MKKFILSVLAVALTSAAFAAAQTIKNDPVINIMNKELNRSFKKLAKATPPVYFLAYTITDANNYYTAAVLGGISYEYANTKRFLDVEARTGSRKMDNTRKIKSFDLDDLSRGGAGGYSVPMGGDDAKTLQTVLWLKTEDTVKSAQEDYLKVKTNSATASERSDSSDDFSAPIAAHSFYQAKEMPAIDKEAVKQQIKEYSTLFTGYDFILTSSVEFSAQNINSYFVNTEDAKIRKGQNLLRLSYSISSRNKDGMELQRGNSYDSFTFEGLPKPEVVKADIAKSIEELKALQNAPVAEPFHGPAILKNRATGVFFHEILGHRIEGHRQKDDDFGQTFTAKVNQQIISPLISVYDNPLLANFNGTDLRGHYMVDDEGVMAQNLTLIENGVLKNFLMSRSPVNNFPQSNGHGRKEPGRTAVSRMGTTIVKASKTVTFEELRNLLIEEIKKQDKPYGLIIDDISGGFTMTDTSSPQAFKVLPLLVYKVYPDGRPDEIIRGADIVGTPLVSFNKITAAANDDAVFNGSCGAESGWVPVSAIAPSVLVSEIEVEKVEKSYENLPLIPAPPAQTKQEVK